MTKNTPVQIAMDTIQDLPETAPWSEIVFELRRSWAQTATSTVLRRAQEVFGDKYDVVEWLTSPCTALGGILPIEVIENGRPEEIIAELTRIEHGIVS